MSHKKKPLIFEVSQNNFEDLVMHNSSHLPVLIEFMGIWSELKVFDLVGIHFF
jgi:putative thioredoxin